MLTLNFNWDLKDASCADLLKLYLSKILYPFILNDLGFSDNLSLKHFYNVPSNESDRL